MYVIYDKDTTNLARVWRQNYWQDAEYETESAAKAGLTRMKKAGKKDTTNLVISSKEEFRKIEKYEIVTNLMSGKPVRQRVNTPRCCDPSSELYWCM